MARRTRHRTRPDPSRRCFPTAFQGLTIAQELQPNGLHPNDFGQVSLATFLVHLLREGRHPPTTPTTTTDPPPTPLALSVGGGFTYEEAHDANDNPRSNLRYR
jgi:hypothetical protein